MPSALILILGRATLWQVRRACGGLRRSRLRCSCDAAKAQRVQFELLLPCVPGALPEEADPRECFARNAERGGRLSRKGVLHRMSPAQNVRCCQQAAAKTIRVRWCQPL